MKCIAVKIKPKSFFHLGEREKWAEGSKTYWPADTIFSALCHAYFLLDGQANSLVEVLKNGEPPFLLSSAFPFWKDDYFFPLPRNKFLHPEELEEVKGIPEIDLKQIKKIQYVNLNALRFLLEGGTLRELLLSNQDIKIYPPIFKPSSPADKMKVPQLYGQENVPRVALSRLSNHPGENFFHFGQVFYYDEAGLFILIKINQPEWENKIKALFYLLSHEGIGGDRTCGKGIYHKPYFDAIDLPSIENGEGLYCLSPYFPAENEYFGLAEGYYELEERKGYIFSPFGRSLRRRSIRVFAEGSVFPKNVNRRGLLIEVTPAAFKEHPVYRYGLLYSLPCRLEAKK